MPKEALGVHRHNYLQWGGGGGGGGGGLALPKTIHLYPQGESSMARERSRFLFH